MTQIEIEDLLIKTVVVVQRQSGREEKPVTRDTQPFDDLQDFDSLNGVEVTVDVMEQLEIDLTFNNVFVDDERPLTIKQAAERLMEQLKKVKK